MEIRWNILSFFLCFLLPALANACRLHLKTGNRLTLTLMLFQDGLLSQLLARRSWFMYAALSFCSSSRVAEPPPAVLGAACEEGNSLRRLLSHPNGLP